jgi:carbon monoxide dehydrogenase subunit G
MKLESSFVVPAPSRQVMPLLLDAPTMGACIPGCTEFVQVDEKTYTGRLVNEVAHVRFNAAFSAEITARDEQEVRAVLRGEDKKLASTLKLDATLRVVPDGDSSLVSYTIEMAMWGKLGRMGESIFRRRTAEVEKEFVAAFTRACREQQAGTLPASPPAEPALAVVPSTAPVAAPVALVRTAPPEDPAPVRAPEHRSSQRHGFWRALVALVRRWSGRR